VETIIIIAKLKRIVGRLLEGTIEEMKKKRRRKGKIEKKKIIVREHLQRVLNLIMGNVLRTSKQEKIFLEQIKLSKQAISLINLT